MILMILVAHPVSTPHRATRYCGRILHSVFQVQHPYRAVPRTRLCHKTILCGKMPLSKPSPGEGELQLKLADLQRQSCYTGYCSLCGWKKSLHFPCRFLLLSPPLPHACLFSSAPQWLSIQVHSPHPTQLLTTHPPA